MLVQTAQLCALQALAVIPELHLMYGFLPLHVSICRGSNVGIVCA